MTELNLSIFNPNTLLPHRAGIAGLALAYPAIDSDDVPFSWEVTDDAINLSWSCSDREAVLSLLGKTYRIEDGYLDVPALNLDRQGKYTILDLYDLAFQFFKPQVRTNDKGETWLAISKVLPWLCDNLILDKPWYSGFYEWKKQNELYERKGLVSMSQYLNPIEQKLFNAVQGAFRTYLSKQREQARNQGRKPDYPQVTNKMETSTGFSFACDRFLYGKK